MKAAQTEFPVRAIQDAGYHAVWKGQETWNRVAILSKSAEPVVTTTSLPGTPSDHQSRYIEAAIAGILIGSLYAPNGNPSGLRLDHLLVSPSLSEKLTAASVDQEVRGHPGASDHAPAWILLGR